MGLTKVIGMIGLGLLGSGCATQEQLINKTETGFPQAVFKKDNLSSVKAKITDYCDGRGFTVDIENENRVICRKPLKDDFSGFLYRALATEKYSTIPVATTAFTVYPNAVGIKVTTNIYLEHQGAFGKVTKRPYHNVDDLNKLQQRLYDMGGE
jgi:hypothetical protein